jgi:hypothetical protein
MCPLGCGEEMVVLWLNKDSARPDHMQILLCSEALLVSTKLSCKSAGSAVAHDLLVFPCDYCKLGPPPLLPLPGSPYKPQNVPL